jgi:hypothetical protein
MGMLLALVTSIRLALKNNSHIKRSSLFCLRFGDEEKKNVEQN